MQNQEIRDKKSVKVSQLEPIPLVRVKITVVEAALLYKLRQHKYGEFTVCKANDQLTRVVNNASEALVASDGIRLVKELEELERQGKI